MEYKKTAPVFIGGGFLEFGMSLRYCLIKRCVFIVPSTSNLRM